MRRLTTATAAQSAVCLLVELERAQQAIATAERAARTYLARRGVLDQTEIDLAAALRAAGETDDVSAAALNDSHSGRDPTG
jgi:hypothetical protein